jgi:hypothetical protein
MCWLWTAARSDANRFESPSRVQFMNASCIAAAVDEPPRGVLGAFNVPRQKTDGSCTEDPQAAPLSAGKRQRFPTKPMQYSQDRPIRTRSGR